MSKKFLILIIVSISIVSAGLFSYRQYSNDAQLPAENMPDKTDKPKEGNKESPLVLPSGFSASVFAKDLTGARVMAFDPAGNLMVSLTSQGKIVDLSDKNGDGKADEEITVVDKLNNPHGLAFRCADKCVLYIAESHRVMAYD